MACFLIVGGAGYIGSHVAHKLAATGNEVVVLDDLSKGHRKAVGDATFVKGDLGDRALLDRIFRERAIDCVMPIPMANQSCFLRRSLKIVIGLTACGLHL